MILAFSLNYLLKQPVRSIYTFNLTVRTTTQTGREVSSLEKLPVQTGQFAHDGTFRRDLVCAISFGQGAGALDTQSAHLRIPVNDVQVHQRTA